MLQLDSHARSFLLYPPPINAHHLLNLQDWRDMCTAYEVQESHVPHRVHGKVAKEERKKKKSRKSH